MRRENGHGRAGDRGHETAYGTGHDAAYDTAYGAGHDRGFSGPEGGGPYRPGTPGPYRPGSPGRGGIPDSLLVGLLAFLLGLTVLVWTATGLSGLVAHGAWPDGVSYSGTPMALRHLVTEPHDLAAAWPATPTNQLSGYGLFWGLVIGQLMVLLVLSIFVMGTVTRYRAVRRLRRETARRRAAQGRYAETGTGTGTDTGESAGERAGEVPGAQAAGKTAPDTPGTPGTPGLHGTPGTPSTPGPPTTSLTAATQATGATQSTGTTGATGTPAAAAASPSTPVPEQRDVTAPGLAAAALAAAAPVGGSETALPRVRFGTDRAEHRATAAAAIGAATGPLIVATTDPTLWTDTKDARAKLGPLLTYDPAHLLDTPSRLRWSPTAGCEDLATATARATALLAPVRPPGALDAAVADAAQTLLRCWLHAAAVDGRPFRQLHRWAHTSGAAQEPVRILRTRTESAAGQAGELESVLTAHAERRELAKKLVSRSLSALSSIHIRDACNPLRSDSLVLESFLDEGGTLYVVGESLEDPRTDPGAMPLLTALLSHVVEHGRRMAERSSAGRLDPPLTLVLDDIAALAPLPALPGLLETGPRRGMLTLATMRSREQARTRWPHPPLPVEHLA